jgi:hypothetical protein
MFNTTLQRELRLDQTMPAVIEDRFGVSKCLLQQKSTGGENTGCLVDYFLKGTQAIDYFAYSNITTAGAPKSEQIDACLTFSGPAASSDPNVARPFQNCLESNANNTGCEIPHMLWSGRSTNKLPVATQHAMNISDPEKRKEMAQGEIAAAQAHAAEQGCDQVVWLDAVERRPDLKAQGYSAVTNRAYAREVVKSYLTRYAPKGATWEDLARIHNGGPRGHLKKSTEAYWAKVLKAAKARSKQ